MKSTLNGWKKVEPRSNAKTGQHILHTITKLASDILKSSILLCLAKVIIDIQVFLQLKTLQKEKW